MGVQVQAPSKKQHFLRREYGRNKRWRCPRPVCHHCHDTTLGYQHATCNTMDLLRHEDNTRKLLKEICLVFNLMKRMKKDISLQFDGSCSISWISMINTNKNQKKK